MIRKKLAALAMAAFISVSAAAMSVSAIGLGNSGNYTEFFYYKGVQSKNSDYSVADIGGEKTVVNFLVTNIMDNGRYYFSAAQAADLKAERALGNIVSPDEYDYYDIIDIEVRDRYNTEFYPWMRISLSSERAMGYNCIYIVNEDYSLYKSKLYKYENGSKSSVVFENMGKTRFILMKLKADTDVIYLDEDPMTERFPEPVPSPTPVAPGGIPTPEPLPDGETSKPDYHTTDVSKILPDGVSDVSADNQESDITFPEVSEKDITEVSDDVNPELSEIPEISEDSDVSETSKEVSSVISDIGKVSEESPASAAEEETSKPKPGNDGVKTGDAAPTAAVFGTVAAAALITGLAVSKKKKV